MTPLTIGALYGVSTLVVMFSGIPIAFALGIVAVVFMFFFMPASALDTVAQNVYEEMGNIVILSIPLFILKGAAIGRTDAGRDLYLALHAWLQRIPGGLGVANTIACGLFAAMAGSSPATCSAIGSAGIPEMRKRGYPGGFAAGIIAAGGTLGILLPPSITMILYAVAAEVSLGKLFLAGIGPGLLLITLFAIYSVWRYRQEHQTASAEAERTGIRSAILVKESYTRAEKIRLITKVMPFVILLTGVMIALYGGYATPSETAGLGAILSLLIIAIMYRVYTWSRVYPILAVDHLHAAVQVGPARHHLGLRGRARLLPAAGLDHPDDRADRPAAAQSRRLRPDLVRHRNDDRHGDGTDPSSGRAQHLRH
jgi:C4-dicarboxylate transporter DctM subunit